MLRRASWLIALAAMLRTGLGASDAALAQEPAYPTRPVRLLVGFPPGGALDNITRPLAQRLSERLGQPFLVENRPGAASNLAAEAVVRAAADGYLLLMGNHSSLAVNAAVQRDLPFDPARDLAPVAQITTVPFVVAVPAELPVRSMAEFVALARARPGQLNAGSPGIASLQHLAIELLKRQAGVDIVHVPHRGGADVLRELLGGRLQVAVDPYSTFRGAAEAGQLRVLATTQAERLRALPEVPTMAETPGLEGFEAAGFVGVAAPAATPRPVIARLEAAVAWAMRETDLPRLYEAQGLVPRHADAEGFAALVARPREMGTGGAGGRHHAPSVAAQGVITAPSEPGHTLSAPVACCWRRQTFVAEALSPHQSRHLLAPGEKCGLKEPRQGDAPRTRPAARVSWRLTRAGRWEQRAAALGGRTRVGRTAATSVRNAGFSQRRCRLGGHVASTLGACGNRL